MLSMLVASGAASSASTLSGFNFQLDGNPQATGGQDDWQTFTSGGTPQSGFLVTSDDLPFADSDSPIDTTYFTGGGSKDPRLVSQWQWTTGDVAPDKDEILNGFAAAYRTAPYEDGGPDGEDDSTYGDLIVYFGADRFANNGDAMMGFWFFKDTIDTAEGGGFTGAHQNGDVLVITDFTGGGQTSFIKVYVWDDSVNGNLRELNIGTGSVDCTASGHNPYVCATANTEEVDALWSYTPKAGAANKYPVSTFFEGGVNLTQLLRRNNAGGTAADCVSSFMAETRSSTSTTAQLKDFALDGFNVCGPLTVKKYIDANEDGTFQTGSDYGTLGLSLPASRSGDLTGWEFEVVRDATSAVVCTGTTNAAGTLVCSQGSLSNLIPGAYTITEKATALTKASTPAGTNLTFFNTDPGGDTPDPGLPMRPATPPVSKSITVGPSGGSVAFGNTCLATLDLQVGEQNANIPGSVSGLYIWYEVGRITDNTDALDPEITWENKQKVAKTASSGTISHTVSGLVSSQDRVRWGFGINWDGTTDGYDNGTTHSISEDEKTVGTTSTVGYPTCDRDVTTPFNVVNLNGFKYEDTNNNGSRQTPDEHGLGGFVMELYDNAAGTGDPLATTVTATAGTYSFTGVSPGTYYVKENLNPTSPPTGGRAQPGWVQTEPVNNAGVPILRQVAVNLTSTSPVTIDNIGNTPTSKVDVTFTPNATLPAASPYSDGAGSTIQSITCREGLTTSGTALSGTPSNSNKTLTVDGLKLNQSPITCVVQFNHPHPHTAP